MKISPGVASSGPALVNQRVKIADFTQRPGVQLDLTDPGLPPPSTLMRGNFHLQEIGEDLRVRCGDCREECAYTATAMLGAGLSCIVFLRGDIDIRIDSQQHRFSAHPDSGIELLCIHSDRPRRFQRICRQPQEVRYLVITTSCEWLENRFGNDASAGVIAGFLQKSLSMHTGRLTSRQRTLAWEVIRLQISGGATNPLLLEARVIELLASTLDTLSLPLPGTAVESLPKNLTAREVQCFQRARDTIRGHLSASLSVDQIARASGISTSGLQRLFHKVEGISVIEFTRRQRLHRALDALRCGAVSVQEASVLAGYSSAANFATAFKKMFGFSPREAMLQT